VEIHIQPVSPTPCLLVYGLSPTARALVRLGKAMGYAVALIDPAAEAVDFPDADGVLTDPAAAASWRGTVVADPSSSAASATAPFPTGLVRHAVVATQGQWDEEAIAAALALDPAPAYIGVMASARRFAEIGLSGAAAKDAAAFDRIKNPAGLDLGATSPEEIALSILAEIVAQRRKVGAAVSPLAETAPPPVVATAPAASHGEPPSPSRRVRLTQVEPTPAVGEARDPVCGMMVATAGAGHRALHEGRDYYFCCGGCRARFLAAPSRFVAAGAAT
jgi:xanthine dehydrogenase accessory factor